MWDVECRGRCITKAEEEIAPGTRLVFPYRGVYVHAVGSRETVGDVNQLVIINDDEPYQVSHPVPGGDATLTLALNPAALLEIMPRQYRRRPDQAAFNRSGLPVDGAGQILAARLRQHLRRSVIDPLHAESLALELARHAVGSKASLALPYGDGARRAMANQVKLLLSSDPGRRWTLSEVANQVGVTPVYLTDAFRHVEGIPLYRYHLRLRLAAGLSVLGNTEDLTTLALTLGFTSHSHFTSAFRKAFGCTPSHFRRSIGGNAPRLTADTALNGHQGLSEVYISRTLATICVDHDESRTPVPRAGSRPECVADRCAREAGSCVKELVPG
ncbi:helix-turn-helix transcriptional regulator [Mycobacterium paraterrae]|uniref:AraC family transcriptional regulator n=1 Tax=Mycobacterium paraterrae TaxID=577492 RepID=A0ABY3VM88_9MYCO|nr:AraC family transcriptional regulator [Mycobacterium paraterrae]UMB69732.1 AraC family transcriptional regulator [Mycobacterium paraterrae]